MEETKIRRMEIVLNKRAQTPEDVLYMVVFLLALAIGAVMTTYAVSSFVDKTEEVPMLNNTKAQAAFQTADDVGNYWDMFSLVIVIAFALGVMILGYFIDVSSVFMPIYLFIMIIGVVVCGALSHVWKVFASQPQFAVTLLRFPITNHIVNNLAIYFTIIAGLSFIVTYAKTRQGGERQ